MHEENEREKNTQRKDEKKLNELYILFRWREKRIFSLFVCWIEQKK